jgi:hypothetical protein
VSHRRNPSKDRFRAGRRIAEKAARKARSPQLVFAWFEDHAVPAGKDLAPGRGGRAKG